MYFYEMSEYGPWHKMLERCYDKKNNRYKTYGAVGITVHDAWREDFLQFVSDIGPRPSLKYTIDRYPNKNGNYEPGNVRWATYKEQMRNKNNNILVMFGGDLITFTEAIERSRTKLHKQTIRLRMIRRCQSFEQAISDIDERQDVTTQVISDIRIAVASGRKTRKELQAEYGLSKSAVARYARGDIQRALNG